MIIFDKENHRYSDSETGKVLISVTQLLRKHNLAPDFSNVPEAVLKAKAERGSLIHEEIENYNKSGEVGFTEELGSYIDYIKENKLKVKECELLVGNDIVVGRLDQILETEDGKLIIADNKTTAKIEKDYVSWQLSVYAYLYGKKISYYQVFHFDADGKLKVVNLKPKPKKEIEKLLDCERKGELYKQPLVASEKDLAKLYDLEDTIKRYELMKKEAEEKRDSLREKLLKAMEDNSIRSFENERIKVSYVDPIKRTSIDSTRLKKELPEIAEKYSKETVTKASLRITLKGEK